MVQTRSTKKTSLDGDELRGADGNQVNPSPPHTSSKRVPVPQRVNANDGQRAWEVQTRPPPTALHIYVYIAMAAFMAGLLTPQCTHRLLQYTGYSTSKQYTEHSKSKGYRSMQERSSGRNLEGVCNQELLSQVLHEEFVQGLNVVCILPGARLTLFQGASQSTKRTLVMKDKSPSWGDVRQNLVNELHLRPAGPLDLPWALFTTRGERIVGEKDIVDQTQELSLMNTLMDEQVLVICNGGVWVWPGVRVGYERAVDLYSIMPGQPVTSAEMKRKKTTVTLQTLSLQPLILSVKGFLSEEECDHVQEKAEPHVRYSGVSHMDKDVGKPASEWRTSQSTFLRASEDEMMIDLERRTASLTRISRTHQEDLQVLRYEPGQKYSAHTDYFDARNYQKDPYTLSLIENGRRNRLATVFWYLSDVDQGGETEFPRANGAPQPWDLDTCGDGLKVKPERGKVIIFYSLHPDGEGDPLSLHAACPVEKGIKWAANKWVWNAPMSFIEDE
eukprot:scaffold2550_cov48-Attheya_sp.AAC.4